MTDLAAALQRPERLRWEPLTATSLWIDRVGFVAVHIGAIAALWRGVSTGLVLLAIATYLPRVLGVTLGLHRLLSHKTFNCSTGPRTVLVALGTLAMQRSVLWWVGIHRLHHAHEDSKYDPHSPHDRSFLHAQVGWFLSSENNRVYPELTEDISAMPDMMRIERLRGALVVAFAGILLAVSLDAFLWGFCVSSVVLWHMVLLTGSWSHLGGDHREPGARHSRDSKVLSLLLLGDGRHGTHHANPQSAQLGHGVSSLDVGYLVIRGLERIGWATDVQRLN